MFNCSEADTVPPVGEIFFFIRQVFDSFFMLYWLRLQPDQSDMAVSFGLLTEMKPK